MCYCIVMDVCPGTLTLYLSVNLHRLEKNEECALAKLSLASQMPCCN